MADGTPVQIEYEGQTYASLSAMSRAFGVTANVLSRAAQRGMWRGKPIRRVEQQNPDDLVPPDQRAEHDAIQRLLGRCSENQFHPWGATR